VPIELFTFRVLSILEYWLITVRNGSRQLLTIEWFKTKEYLVPHSSFYKRHFCGIISLANMSGGNLCRPKLILVLCGTKML